MATFTDTIDTPGSYTFQFPTNGEDNQFTGTIDLPPTVNALTINIQGPAGAASDGQIETVVLNFPPGFSLISNGSLPLGGNETPPAETQFFFLQNQTGGIVGNIQITANNVTIVEDFIPICFVKGTRILTAKDGYKPIEEISVGERVLTRDNGMQPVKWIAKSYFSQKMMAREPKYAPVCFAPNAIGNESSLRLSSQHRILIIGSVPEVHFGQSEVLVPAKAFLNASTVTRPEPEAMVTYYHLLLDNHELILSDGVWSESLQPGSQAMISAGGLAEYEKAIEDSDEAIAARPALKGWEAEMAARLILQDYVIDAERKRARSTDLAVSSDACQKTSFVQSLEDKLVSKNPFVGRSGDQGASRGRLQ